MTSRGGGVAHHAVHWGRAPPPLLPRTRSFCTPSSKPITQSTPMPSSEGGRHRCSPTWRSPTTPSSSERDAGPWRSQPLTPATISSRPATAPLAEVYSEGAHGGPPIFRLPLGQRRPPLLTHGGSSGARLPLPTPASRRDIVEQAAASAGPLRLQTPSAELRALDEAYDRQERTSPIGRSMAARRAGDRRRSDAYFGRDEPGNPMRVVAYVPAYAERGGVARSIAIGDSRAAPVVVAALAGGAAGVRRIGGTSTVGRERTRAPVVMFDPQLRELQELARAWTGTPGARGARGR